MAANDNLSRDEAAQRAACVTIDTYRVEVDLSQVKDTSIPTYASRSTIVFDATCDETWLDFIGAGVRELTVNGEARELATAVDGDRIRLSGLRLGRNEVSVLVDAAYSRSGEGLHRFTDEDGLVYTYTQFEPADARRVFANFEQPDLKASFTFVITGPSDWELLSNQHVESREESGELVTLTYAPTKRQSTYITCISAGPYARFDDVYRGTNPDGTPVEIALGLFCRQSLAPHLDAQRLFAQTKQGFDFFPQLLDYPYPWGTKYDQIFVPEYNLGAMENTGLVTFTDEYIFRSKATRAQYAARCNTLLHEMSHMWFGDLVTMKWWDDLWLKESFADFLGTFASAEGTEYAEAWVGYAAGRKAWAYLQDQLPTTHPIVADIPDLEAADQNFDGITYAKGASVLKQLVAYVGRDAFIGGAQAYFKAHEYGNTVLNDLLVELERTSGRDMRTWSRLWLETTGVSTLTPLLEADDNGLISRLAVEQRCDDGLGGNLLRPHRMNVGLYEVRDSSLVRTELVDLDITAEVTEIPQLVGKRYDLLVINDDDHTFAKVRLDARSVETATRHLGSMTPDLSRALVWSSLWNAVRDGVMDARTWLEIALSQAGQESDAGLMRTIQANLPVAAGRYLPNSMREAAAVQLAERSWENLQAVEPGSDIQLAWARAALGAAASPAGAAHLADHVRGLLDGSAAVEGLTMDPDLRWLAWQSLSAAGMADEADVRAELEADQTSQAKVAFTQAMAARPSAQVKADAWTSATSDQTLSNDLLTATIDGFKAPGQGTLRAEFAPTYYEIIRGIWDSRSQEMAGRIVRGLFPDDADDDGVTDPEMHPTVAAASEWLEANTDAPRALRRPIIEARDLVVRSLRAQRAALES